jgi:hypothetical protein
VHFGFLFSFHSAIAYTFNQATYGYMDNEHAFSSAIVLVMSTLIFPFSAQIRESTESALSILRVIAERGNVATKAKYELLQDLRSKTQSIAPKGPGINRTMTTALNTADSCGPATSNIEVPKSPLLFEHDLSFDETVFSDNATSVELQLWEEVYNNMDHGVDWTEETLRMLSY